MSRTGNHNEQSVFKMLVDGIFTVYKKRESNVNITRGNWHSARLEEGEMGDPPIVSFLRMGGVIQATDRPGPHNFQTEDGSETDIWFNSHYEDLATVEVHMTAHDRCETERLWNDVLHATRESLGQLSIPGTYDWPTQTPDGAAHMHAGQEKVIQIFTWRILVPHDSGTRVQVKCIDTEVELQAADGETATLEKIITQTL